MASFISLDDIESWEYCNEEIVYDISVTDNTNYYLDCIKPILVHNSSKTYNTLIWFIIQLLNTRNEVLTICRKTLPSLKATAMRDFFEIIQNMGLYDENKHNKTDNIYNLNSNLVEFVSLDDSQKIRGRKRNKLFINEANEVTFEAFTQLLLRTSGKIVLDFNPSDEYNYIYDKVIPRNDADFYKTTYKDNPFLEQQLIDEIENLQNVDENLWRVFGLGERGSSKATIFTHYKEIDKFPDNIRDWCYGLDFGFNHPLALIKVAYHENKLYWHEEVYQTHLTNSDLIRLMQEIGVPKAKFIYADDANPREIQDIYGSGYNIKPANKGSVGIGINKIKSTPLFITRSSTNLLKELRSYKWKEDKEGKIIDEPVKFNDDACFVFDTEIETNLGKKKIGLIKEGDCVLTRFGYKKVLKFFDNGCREVLDFKIKSGIFEIEITCTSNHKIYTSNGWKSISELTKGDKICLAKSLTEKNTTSILAKNIIQEPINSYITYALENISFGNKRVENVYDLEVDGEHEYFANGLLVHNCDAARYGSLRFLLPQSGATTTSHLRPTYH